MSAFLGRQKELKELAWFQQKTTASLIVLMGRRRIGKTTLVEHFAKGKQFYRFAGLPPTKGITAQEQKQHFLNELANYFGITVNADDWSDIFSALAKLLPSTKTILFFDEISWLASSDKTFLPKLKDAWDKYFNKNNQLIFILCGSVSSWIEEQILANTGFVGRVSLTLRLSELSLHECRLFWGKQAKHIAHYEWLKILSVVGGVPLYLEHIDKHQSAEENIKRLCFTPGGLLVDEFNKIFHDVFTYRSSVYKDILIQLANGSMSIKALADTLNYKLTGRFSQYIHHLEVSGFIKKDYSWNLTSNKPSRISQVRICDNYVRFFLKYIAPHHEQINRQSYRYNHLSSLPGWISMLALQFENLVLNNRDKIINLLHINPAEIINENPYLQRKTKTQPGCQIDYLIQTKFNILYLCEIKFSKEKIGREIITDIERKIAALKRPKGFSIKPVLIHVNGVTSAVEEADYFATIIDFGQLAIS